MRPLDGSGDKYLFISITCYASIQYPDTLLIMLLIRISDDHDREACCKKQVCVHTRVLQLWYGRTTVFLAAKKSMHSARGARAGFHKFSYFPLHGTRAARAHGFDSPPPSRTLEPLAFDEYCRFDTSAFFLRIKRAESRSIKMAIFIKS